MEVAFAEYLAQAPVFLRRLDGEILYWTVGAQELYGYTTTEALGQLSHQLLKTIFPQPLPDIEKTLRESLRWSGLLAHTRADGREIWVESRWRLREGAGDKNGIVVESNTDVTHREILNRELDHRMRNTLAIVQGLARMTFGEWPDRIKTFDYRIQALNAAQQVLLQHHWSEASIGETLQAALTLFGVLDRTTIEGPEVRLSPDSVMAYSLAFHELTTNAVKHGCFRSPGTGHLKVSWFVEEGKRDKIHLIWKESGGEAPSVQRTGSGTRLLRDVIAREFGAKIEMRFEPTGLVCVFDGPTQKETDLQFEQE